jgi:hypothetical protein
METFMTDIALNVSRIAVVEGYLNLTTFPLLQLGKTYGNK